MELSIGKQKSSAINWRSNARNIGISGKGMGGLPLPMPMSLSLEDNGDGRLCENGSAAYAKTLSSRGENVIIDFPPPSFA